MIKSAGPVFNTRSGHTIDVRLPGWHGTLVGKLNIRPRQAGYLAANWVFNHDKGVLVIDESENPSSVTITVGIRVGKQGEILVVDWNQTIKDLGEPQKVERVLNTAEITWSDKHGTSLRAKVPLSMIISAHGITVMDIKDTYVGVTGIISILNGKLIMKDELLATHEQIELNTYRQQPACFRSQWDLPATAREEVIKLLRQQIHTPEWHKEKRLNFHLSKTANWSQALWETLRKLETLLEDEFCTLRDMEFELDNVHKARSRIENMRQQEVQPLLPETLDPSIYMDARMEDNIEETRRLKTENEAMIEQADCKIRELKAKMEKVPSKHAHPDLRVSVWTTTQEMLEDIEHLNSRSHGLFIHDLTLIIRGAEQRENIEDLLQKYQQARRRYQYIIKKVNTED